LGGSPASSTAGLDRSVHDNALSGRHVLDGDYSEAFGEPDGGARFGPADAGALSDPDQWQRASSGRLGLG
jgi:hypothetical protein